MTMEGAAAGVTLKDNPMGVGVEDEGGAGTERKIARRTAKIMAMRTQTRKTKAPIMSIN